MICGALIIAVDVSEPVRQSNAVILPPEIMDWQKLMPRHSRTRTFAKNFSLLGVVQ
jgi:hypothetical protein